MSYHTHFIILNGPPGSGKSTIARELARKLAAPFTPEHRVGIVQDSFAAPMKHFIATALGERYNDMIKDRTYPELNGATVREFLIDMAENFIRQRYGQDIFGRWLYHRAMRWPARKPIYCIVDDGGFEPEVMTLPNHYIVHVHRDGKTFEGDSRSYLRPRGSITWQFDNNGDITQLYIHARELATKIQASLHP